MERIGVILNSPEVQGNYRDLVRRAEEALACAQWGTAEEPHFRLVPGWLTLRVLRDAVVAHYGLDDDEMRRLRETAGAETGPGAYDAYVEEQVESRGLSEIVEGLGGDCFPFASMRRGSRVRSRTNG